MTSNDLFSVFDNVCNIIACHFRDQYLLEVLIVKNFQPFIEMIKAHLTLDKAEFFESFAFKK